KAKEDMDNGRPVDIADATDIDINTKTSPDIEEISLRDELARRDVDNGYEIEVKEFEESFAQADEIKPKEITDEIDKYDGMATKEEGDALILERLSPEEIAEFKANDIEIAQPIKEPIVPTVEVTATTGNIVSRAQALQGNKYVWGGTDLKMGADCSGFVQSIHKEQGINLPRTAWGQAKGSQGKNIAFDDMQVGDTIYFMPSQTGKKYAPVTHTGIITGIKDGKFIMTHAKDKKYGTVTEELSPAYIERFYSAKRFTEEGIPSEKVPIEAPIPKEIKEKVVINEEITPEIEQTILKQEELDTIEFNKLEEAKLPEVEEMKVPEVEEIEAPTIKEIEEPEIKVEPKPIAEIPKDQKTMGELAKISDTTNKDELNKIISKTSPETVGALYGFEQDEEGYWTYNVAKGILGAAGIKLAGKAYNSVKMRSIVKAEMRRQGDKIFDFMMNSPYSPIMRMQRGEQLKRVSKKTDIKHNGKKIGHIKTTQENNFINIDDIDVWKRGTGEGTKAIKEIMKKADNEGLIVTLTSDAMRGKKIQALNRKLYRKLGFIKNIGANKIKGTTEEFYYKPKQ
ncbi:MAG: hypothetical protein E3J43_08640, partial [Candidatus Heimdallarchaeota archaeon]